MSRFLSSVLAMGAAIALATAFSCKTFDLPAETCNPDSLVSSEIAGPDGCKSCMEDRCCDVVGVCEQRDTCPGIVSATQACVAKRTQAGSIGESVCAAAFGLSDKTAVSDKTADPQLVNPEADSAYRCMRAQCGTQCELPVCEVDQAARLILNADCDRCFAAACCAPLNSCYANRACKLTLECIINDCGAALGKDLDLTPAGKPDELVDRPATDAFCALPPASLEGVPVCVQHCMCQYRDNDQELPPLDPGLLPINLAATVYKCGKNSCAAACTVDAGLP